jgi:hypothetical protein
VRLWPIVDIFKGCVICFLTFYSFDTFSLLSFKAILIEDCSSVFLCFEFLVVFSSWDTVPLSIVFSAALLLKNVPLFSLF